ncbi:MAG: hypothetical protein JWO40_332 [Candidatus Doudnabacteria bacterium]|nr:hypothetical protein [Candidatus Doudnabacteria bacterium]
MRNKKFKVLIVDDEELLVGVYHQGLEFAGYEVESASNGLEAIEKIQRTHPDMILLDLLMPGMDGFGVLKNIKQNKELKEIPIIVLSNLSEDANKSESMRLGAVDFVIKSDISPSQLVDKIKLHLKQ